MTQIWIARYKMLVIMAD